MSKNAPFQLLEKPVSRRKILTTSINGGLCLAAGSLMLPFKKSFAAKVLNGATTTQPDDKVVWSMCSVNCGSRCALRLHVKDNEVYWVETDHTGNDEYNDHQVRACLRGRSIRRRINHPDRLKYPMKRVGKRGEGKFVRISWDEALDTIANNLKRILKQYGNESVHVLYGTGVDGGNMTNSNVPYRLMNACGGFLSRYGSYSSSQITMAMPFTYGTQESNSFADAINSKLIVLFGNNPCETRMSGASITYTYEQVRERSQAKVIVIDPRYTDSAGGREDQWVPIRPGTDAALVAGIAHVLITENLVNQPFLDKYCVGYDEKTLPPEAPKNGHYKAYILGQGEDKTEKTPQWASEITGVTPDVIVQLAREIAQAKPAFICQGWGPQRHANGEQTARAIAMLPILTGNIGIHGGNTGAREDSYAITMEYFPTLDNPVKTQISVFTWPDAIDRGTEMTALKDGVRGKDKLDVPIKFLWCYASNTLINQNADINRTHQILQDESKCEFILGIDIFMTASAKYYDILLPDLMSAEQEDFVPNEGGGDMGYLIFGQPATAPKFERRRIYDTLTQIAKRLGPDVEQRFTEGRTQSQWLEYLYEKMRKEDSDLPPYEEMKKRGIFKKKNPGESLVAFKAFRENPEKNPLKTPSGKIEIYSQKLADIAKTWQLEKDEIVTPIPVYAPTREAFDAPLSKKYPLQLSGFHYKARVHSSYANIDVLQAACIQQVWINPIDAKERGINDGDQVRVFNDRGETRLPAKVTPRIMPGVTAMGQGAWYQGNPFESKVDHGGCINILTSSHPSPLSKGNPQHTNLVEIEKI